MASREPKWIASWITTGLVIGQIILLIVLGGGEVEWLRYAGFVLWALAAVFGWVPVYQFKKHGGVAEGDSYVETTRLVDTGLYAIVRHPQYVAWPLTGVAVASCPSIRRSLPWAPRRLSWLASISGRWTTSTWPSSAIRIAPTWSESRAGTSLPAFGVGCGAGGDRTGPAEPGLVLRPATHPSVSAVPSSIQ